MAKADIGMNRALSGHMYFRSPYEGYDSCGTCNGAKCDICREWWEVVEYDDLGLLPGNYAMFHSKEKAEAAIKDLEAKAESM